MGFTHTLPHWLVFLLGQSSGWRIPLSDHRSVRTTSLYHSEALLPLLALPKLTKPTQWQTEKTLRQFICQSCWNVSVFAKDYEDLVGHVGNPAKGNADTNGKDSVGARFWTLARPIDYYTGVFKALARPGQRDTAVLLTTTGFPTASMALGLISCARVVVCAPKAPGHQLWRPDRFAVGGLLKQAPQQGPGGAGAVALEDHATSLDH